MDKEEAAQTLLNPETRNVIQLKVTDYEKTDKLFNDLYGKEIKPRVDFLLKHSEEAHSE